MTSMELGLLCWLACLGKPLIRHQVTQAEGTLSRFKRLEVVNDGGIYNRRHTYFGVEVAPI